MGLFSNMFGGSSETPVATTTPVATPPEVTTPTGDKSAGGEASTGLDKFKGLWEPEVSKDVDGTLPVNMFSGLKPEQMFEAAKKVDFTKSISSDVFERITGGGQDAAKAFSEAINLTAQQAYAHSTIASTKIVEAALAKFQEGMDSRLPSQIKKHSVSDAIRESNPALTHPAAAPILGALEAQLSVKYPNATVSELRGMATQYLESFSQATLPKPKPVAGAGGDDWGKFFS